MTVPAPPEGCDSETTQAGDQRLIAGVAPILVGDRLALRAAEQQLNLLPVPVRQEDVLV